MANKSHDSDALQKADCNPRLVQPLLNVRQHLVDRATNIGAGTCLQKNEILWAIEVVDNELKWQGHPECHFAADNITERTRTARVETYRKLVADGFTHHASLGAARQLTHVG